jgi:hypothetical protein
MSTHFRPRPQPPPAPTSPVRPSTAHSTIRAITPSPPNSSDATFPLPRPKSEHALGSPELATFKQYVLKAEAGGFSNTPVIAGPKLQRGGIASGRSSPIKDGRASPVKARSNSPTKSRSKSPRKKALSALEGFAASPAKDDEPMIDSPVQPAVQEHHEEQDEHEHWPETPTPMSRSQKRQAYTPMSIPAYHAPKPPTATPSHHPSQKPSLLPAPDHGRRNLTIKPNLSPTVSTSSASKHSIGIFSTLGRDELERKKALVEVDEGPFARAKSMVDLRDERRRVGAREEGEKGGQDDTSGEKKQGSKFRCGLECVVM